MRKIISLLLAVLLAASLVPASALASGGGSFVFAAFTNGETVVAPTRLSYTSGQTIRQALSASPIEFTGLQTGYIDSIQGVAAAYYMTDETGGYELDRPAESIQTFLFYGIGLSVYQGEHGPLCDMVTAMAELNEQTNGVQNYQPAKTAYTNALGALYGAGGDYAALAAAIRAAMTEYENTVLGGTTYKAKLTVRSLTTNQTVTGWTLTVTDAYGGQKTFTSGQNVMLRAETYDFVLQKGLYSARGSMTVSTTGAVTVGDNPVSSLYLYDGQWIGDVLLHSTSGDMDTGVYDHAAVSGGWEYAIPDTVGPSVFCYIVKGSGIDGAAYTASNVKCFPVYETIEGKWETGDTPNKRRSWESSYDVITKLLQKDDTPASVAMEARYDHPDGYTVVESRTLSIRRTPTLAALTVRSGGAAQAFGFDPAVTDYALDVSTSSVEVAPVPAVAGYTVTVSGAAVTGGTTVSLDTGENTVPVTVASSNGESRTYTLRISRVEAVRVTVTHPAGVTALVENAAGAVIGPESSAGDRDTFLLVPGAAYSLIGTKNEYYHTRAAFTASDGLSLTAAAPVTSDWLTGLSLRSRTKEASSDIYLARADFDPAQHAYEIAMDDVLYSFYAAATASRGTVTAVEPGKTITNTASNIGTSATNINRWMTAGDTDYTVTFRVTDTVSGTENYQDYPVHILRRPTATALTLTVEGEAVNLYPVEDGVVSSRPGFDDEVGEYQAGIMRSAAAAELRMETYLPSYTVWVGEEEYSSFDPDTGEDTGSITVTVPLDSYQDQETAELTVRSVSPGTVPHVYSVTLIKRDAAMTAVHVTDEGGTALPEALAAVYDTRTGDRIWPDEEGLFPLVEGTEYRVVSTCLGYVGDERTFTAGEDIAAFTVALAAAPETQYGEGITSDWPSFRGSDDANGVISAKTPVTAETAMLSWASRLGEGYDSQALSCPILITEDGYDYLIVYAGNTIYKVDAICGETVIRADMDHASSFAINSPTFAEGMIFVGLAGGGVQAFDASTLESLWLYRDELGGQPNNPITYYDGYIYTGFWNSETGTANYVCLSVTDEDPDDPMEPKLAAWTHASRGGYYWAGAYVTDGYMLVGTDDGHTGYTTESASLLCLDPKTGAELDRLDGLKGDVRSSVCYDAATDRFYFTTKGGGFYSVKVTETDGAPAFDRPSFRRVWLDNGGDDPNAPAMSTCTPVVYGGRAYVGVGGVGHFTAYSGHNISVIDLTTWTVAYSVATQGFPQTSGLLTDGYGDGAVYVYFFDNYTPGKLRVLRDRPGQTEPDLVTLEEFSSQGSTTVYTTPYVLFTPAGEQAQYAICSPISDDYGVIYFKNDSANLMAVSNTIESLEVVTPPAKTEYSVGETFDGTGMEVRLTYVNGESRVLPESREAYGVHLRYFTWSEEPLTAEDATFFVRFAPTMYQDAQGEIGYPYLSPTAAVSLVIRAGCEITVSEPPALETRAGETVRVELGGLFADSMGHALTYVLESADGGSGRISGSRLLFTASEPGTYHPAVTASCTGGQAAILPFEITVTEAAQGADRQYDYEETDAESVTVTVTVSAGGVPLMGESGALAQRTVTVPYFDLSQYGLEDYTRFHTADGSGDYADETAVRRPTLLHLLIWLAQREYMGLEEGLCGPNGGEHSPLDYISAGPGPVDLHGDTAYDDTGMAALAVSGGACSLSVDALWGHGDDLTLLRNHALPLMSPGRPATADYVLLSDGDAVELCLGGSGALCLTDGSGGTMDAAAAAAGQELGFTVSRFDDGFVPVPGMTVEVYGGDWTLLDSFTADSADTGYTFPEPGDYHLLAVDPSGDLGPAAARVEAREPDTARIVSASLTLSGDIGVNFYVVPDEAMLSDPGACARFTYRGAEGEPMLLSEARTDVKNGVTRYVFTRFVAAKEMEEQISLRLYSSDGVQAALLTGSGNPVAGNAARYSVAKYVATVTSASGRALAAKLGSFGAASAAYFGYTPVQADTSVPALAVQAETVSAADLPGYKTTRTGTVTGLTVASMSLTLESLTTVNLGFTVASGHQLGEYSFTLDGRPVTPQKSGSRYYITVPNVAAKELDTVYTVTATNGSQTMTVTCSALSYAYNTLKNYESTAGKEALCTLVRALWAYNQAANAYFGD